MRTLHHALWPAPAWKLVIDDNDNVANLEIFFATMPMCPSGNFREILLHPPSPVEVGQSLGNSPGLPQAEVRGIERAWTDDCVRSTK